MSAARVEEEKLQQYFDGELSPAEAEQIRQVLEASEVDRARLERLERLRGLLVAAARESALDVEAEPLFDRIRAGIETQKAAGYHEPFGVVQGERGAERPTRLERWKVWGPAAALVAVAAAVLLFVMVGQKEDTSARRDRDGMRAEEETAIAQAGVTTIEAPQGSQVEEVDFGENTGTVFAVEGEAGEPIAVVWINDEPTEHLQ